MNNYIGKLIHNCVAHPLMCFLPQKWGDKFHDWTIETFWPAAEFSEDEDTETL